MKERRIIDVEQELLDLRLVESFRGGGVERVRVLLSDGANIHAQDDRALRWSAENGHAGVDIHADEGYALRRAIRDGHFEVVNILLTQGADIEVGI